MALTDSNVMSILPGLAAGDLIGGRYTLSRATGDVNTGQSRDAPIASRVLRE
jgi:hypothetical protein